MTNLEIHLGFEHVSTTGVPFIKFLITCAVNVLPSQFMALTHGSFFSPFSYSGRSSYEYGCSANLVRIFGDPFFVGKTESSPDHCMNRAFILVLICSLTSVPSSKASKENLLMISPFLNMVSSPSVFVSFSSFCRRSTIFLS